MKTVFCVVVIYVFLEVTIDSFSGYSTRHSTNTRSKALESIEKESNTKLYCKVVKGKAGTLPEFKEPNIFRESIFLEFRPKEVLGETSSLFIHMFEFSRPKVFIIPEESPVILVEDEDYTDELSSYDSYDDDHASHETGDDTTVDFDLEDALDFDELADENETSSDDTWHVDMEDFCAENSDTESCEEGIELSESDDSSESSCDCCRDSSVDGEATDSETENDREETESKGSENESKGGENENTDTENENRDSENGNTGSENENSVNQNENTSSENENTSSENENTYSENENTDSENENIGSENENTGSGKENTGRGKENTGSENIVSENEKTGSEHESTGGGNENTDSENENTSSDNENPVSKNENTGSKNQNTNSANENTDIESTDSENENTDNESNWTDSEHETESGDEGTESDDENRNNRDVEKFNRAEASDHVYSGSAGILLEIDTSASNAVLEGSSEEEHNLQDILITADCAHVDLKLYIDENQLQPSIEPQQQHVWSNGQFEALQFPFIRDIIRTPGRNLLGSQTLLSRFGDIPSTYLDQLVENSNLLIVY